MKLKFITLTLLLATGSMVPVMAQSASYRESLKKNISLFQSATTSTEFIKAANSFEILALSEKKEWLPFYYAGLCDVLAAFEKPKKEIDPLCDKAESFARRADSLSRNNSEILVLKSMIAAARINANQLQRGQKYGMAATRFANEAVKLNDANPRAHFVKAQAILYTPPAFGGGEKKAKPVFELAIEKAKTFKPESALYPSWGKEEAEKELKKLNTKPKQ